eukprot:5422783-Prymnesium_polylepis.3
MARDIVKLATPLVALATGSGGGVSRNLSAPETRFHTIMVPSYEPVHSSVGGQKATLSTSSAWPSRRRTILSTDRLVSRSGSGQRRTPCHLAGLLLQGAPCRGRPRQSTIRCCEPDRHARLLLARGRRCQPRHLRLARLLKRDGAEHLARRVVPQPYRTVGGTRDEASTRSVEFHGRELLARMLETEELRARADVPHADQSELVTRHDE